MNSRFRRQSKHTAHCQRFYRIITNRTITRRYAVFVCTLFALLALPSLHTHAALSAQHSQMAGSIALDQPWPQTRSAASTGSHPLGVQTLSVERDEGKKGDTRQRARVYQFNYHTQQSRVVLINIASESVEKVRFIDTVHLPLNPVEIAQARKLVESNQETMRRLNMIQSKKGLTPLNDLSTIDVKASIYEPDNAQHACAVQRCALISLFDQTRTVFALEPIVNLQSSSVTTLVHGD